MFKNFNAWTIHPLLRGADFSRYEMLTLRFDSSPHTRGRLGRQVFVPVSNRFIPSFERQTAAIKDTSGVRYDSSPPTRDRPFFCFIFLVIYRIHPLIRGAGTFFSSSSSPNPDSSPPTRDRCQKKTSARKRVRFIPS